MCLPLCVALTRVLELYNQALMPAIILPMSHLPRSLKWKFSDDPRKSPVICKTVTIRVAIGLPSSTHMLVTLNSWLQNLGSSDFQPTILCPAKLKMKRKLREDSNTEQMWCRWLSQLPELCLRSWWDESCDETGHKWVSEKSWEP